MLGLIDTIVKVAGKFIPDQDKVLELKAELLKQQGEFEKQITEHARMDHELRMKEFEHKGFKSWWRQILAFGLGIIAILYGLLYLIIPGIVHYLVVFNVIDPGFWSISTPTVSDSYWYLNFLLLGGGWALRSLVDKRIGK